MGPFAGFIGAWNFGAWALLLLANLGIVTATSLSYAIGPRAAWMVDGRAFVSALDIGLFAAILAINIPAFGSIERTRYFCRGPSPRCARRKARSDR